MTNKSLFMDYKFQFNMIRSLTTLCCLLMGFGLFAHNNPTEGNPPNNNEGGMIISYVATKPSCAGYTDGSIAITVYGSHPPFNYVWGNGLSNQDLTGIPAGTYTVTATDSEGDTKVETIVLQDNPPLNLLMEKEDAPCFMACDGVAKAIVTGGVGPFVYTWTNGFQGGAVNFPLPPGFIGVTVTDANGCSISDGVDIYEPSKIQINVTSVAGACGGNSGSATVSASGGTPPFNYFWNYNNVTGPTLSGAPAGTYVVLVTDANGCQRDTFVTIDAGTGLDLQLATTSAQCVGQNTGTATVAVMGGGVGPYSYAWSVQPGVNTPTITGLQAGQVVTVTVTDQSNGCQGIATQTVSGHTSVGIQTDGSTVNCPNDLTGTVNAVGSNGFGPYTYAWDINGTIVNTQTVGSLPAGGYTVTVTDANGCSNVSGAVVNSSSTLNAAFNASAADCASGTPGLNLTDASVDANSWSWNVAWPTGSQTFTNQNPGQVNIPGGVIATVQLTVTSATGCTDMASQTVMTGIDGIDAAATGSAVNCPTDANGSVTANGQNGTGQYTYSWDINGNTVQTQSVTNLPVGTYNVTVTDANGCTSATAASVASTSQLNAAFNADVADCMNNMTGINLTDASSDPNSNITSWSWTVTSPAGTQTFNNQNPGQINLPSNVMATVELTVTSAAGCSDTETQNYQVAGLPDLSLAGQNPAASCNGAPVAVQVTGGQPNFNYTWTPASGVTQVNGATDVTLDPSIGSYQLIAENGGCADTLDVNTLIAPPINLMAGDDIMNSCNPNEMLTATTAVTSTFVWSDANGIINTTPNATSSSTSVVPSGMNTYTVVATDQYGCTETADQAVSGDALDVTLNASSITDCENTPASISFTNNGNLTNFMWVSNDPNLTIADPNAMSTTVNGPAGTYMVQLILENNNCQDTLPLTVTYNAGVSLIGDIEFDLCDGLPVDYSISAAGITGTWDFGDGSGSTAISGTHIYASSGVYTVTFEPDQNCVAVFEEDIMVLDSAAVNAAFDQNLVSCEDEAVFNLFDQSTSANGLDTYAWFVNGISIANIADPTITFDTIGPADFMLVVTDVNGCKDSITKELPWHIVSDTIAADQSFCVGGDSINLNPTFNTDYAYTWFSSPVDPNLVSNVPNPTVLPSDKTTYTVSITLGGCIITKTVEIDPNDAAELTGPNIDSLVVCDDAPVILTAGSPNGTVEWSESPDFTPSTISDTYELNPPQRFGIYYVRATTADGCRKVDTVKVHNGQIDVATNQSDPHRCIENDVPVQLEVQNLIMDDMLTISWDNGLPAELIQNVLPTETTTYTASIVNNWGCSALEEFTIDVIALSATLTTDRDTICPDQIASLTATATGGANYDYFYEPTFDVQSGQGTPNATVIPSASTVYSVIVTDDKGCTTEASIPIEFRNLTCDFPYIFIPKAFTPNGDGNNENFMVRGHNITKLLFVVYNRWGEEMYKTEDPNALGWDGRYKGQELTADSYGWYVRLTCDDGEEYIDKGNVTLLK